MADDMSGRKEAMTEVYDPSTELVVQYANALNIGVMKAGSDLVRLHDAGLAVIPDEPDHYVTFDQAGWFIVHSVACRVAGTLGTCEYNAAVREIAEDFDPDDDPDQLGRWKITEIDSEGLPSLERAGGSDV